MWYDSLNIVSLLALPQGTRVVNNIIGEATPELVLGSFQFQGYGRELIVFRTLKTMHSVYSIEVK